MSEVGRAGGDVVRRALKCGPGRAPEGLTESSLKPALHGMRCCRRPCFSGRGEGVGGRRLAVACAA